MNWTIAEYLYHAFRKYVKQKDLKQYDDEFYNTVKNSVKSIKGFFPKYINIHYYKKNFKKPEDYFLFTYFLIDLDTYGLKRTNNFEQIRYF